MKLSKIALAGMVMISGSAFAQTAESLCTTAAQAIPVDLVNKCLPEATLFIAGSSALGDSVNGIISSGTTTFSNYFDTTKPIVKVVDAGSPSLSNVAAWYGTSKALTGVTTAPRLLIVYNKNNGSAAGVSNVMATDAKSLLGVSEAKVVAVGPVLKGKTAAQGYNSNNCSAGTGTASTVVTCTSFAPLKADVALSDVDASELISMYPNKKIAFNQLERKAIGMQGFAIAVNNKFYDALAKEQIRLGTLSSSCATTTGTEPNTTTSYTYSEACQPNISRTQYSSLVTSKGTIKSSAGFIPNDTTKLFLARRDQLSGTQAVSNMYFANAICADADPKSKVNVGGAMEVLRAIPATAALEVHENVATGDVETDLKDNTKGYSIGVIALSKGSASTYKFVKLDGASPNFAKGSSTLLSGAALRNNMVDGTWPLQVVSYAMYTKASVATAGAKKELINRFVSDMTNSNNHDLTAISYFDGAVAAQQSKVTRVSTVAADGTPTYNNCSPLTFK